nr:D-alanine--D-alanine ligase [Bacteroidota bacterium]
MKKNIAIISGGYSGEYEISFRSGMVVYESLDAEKYNSYLIQVKEDEWFYENGDRSIEVDKTDCSLLIDGKKVRFDVVFCAIHGTPGEDGKMPAYFEMLKIPFTSSGSIASALTFDKNLCNRVVATYDVNVASSVHYFRHDKVSTSEIAEKLSFPVFVKPNCGGSSVGMSKVMQVEDLRAAIEKAFAEDDEILIEEFVKGRELTCGVLSSKGKLYVFPICEIVSKKEFFDFEAKYDPALAEEIVPADIPVNLETEIKNSSAFLFNKLNCKGVVRFDYIYSESDRELYFLEVNTVPGLTRESIVPKMAREMDISLSQLFSMMIEDAVWRHKQ